MDFVNAHLHHIPALEISEQILADEINSPQQALKCCKALRGMSEELSLLIENVGAEVRETKTTNYAIDRIVATCVDTYTWYALCYQGLFAKSKIQACGLAIPSIEGNLSLLQQLGSTLRTDKLPNMSAHAPITLWHILRLATQFGFEPIDWSRISSPSEFFRIGAPANCGEDSVKDARPLAVFIEDLSTMGFDGYQFVVGSTKPHVHKKFSGLFDLVEDRHKSMIPPEMRSELLELYSKYAYTDGAGLHNPQRSQMLLPDWHKLKAKWRLSMMRYPTSGEQGGIVGIAIKKETVPRWFLACYRCQRLWKCRVPEALQQSTNPKLSDEELAAEVGQFNPDMFDRDSFCAESYAQATKALLPKRVEKECL